MKDDEKVVKEPTIEEVNQTLLDRIGALEQRLDEAETARQKAEEANKIYMERAEQIETLYIQNFLRAVQTEEKEESKPERKPFTLDDIL